MGDFEHYGLTKHQLIFQMYGASTALAAVGNLLLLQFWHKSLEYFKKKLLKKQIDPNRDFKVYLCQLQVKNITT